MSAVKPCPECAAGKCRNCDGTAWDDALDDVTDCPCATAGHPRSDPVNPDRKAPPMSDTQQTAVEAEKPDRRHDFTAATQSAWDSLIERFLDRCDEAKRDLDLTDVQMRELIDRAYGYEVGDAWADYCEDQS